MSAANAAHGTERELLAAILQDPGAVDRAADLLTESNFADPFHRQIFRAMVAAYAGGIPSDVVTLHGIDPTLELGKLTGYLANVVGTSAHLEYYADTIRRASVQRRKTELVQRLAVAVNAGDEAAERLARAELAALDEDDDRPRRYQLVDLAGVATKQIDWLWRGRLARGMITVIDGDPGLGKSTLIVAVVAAITRGRPISPGDPAQPPATVLITNYEDGLAEVIVPRLRAAGADMSRVRLLTIPDGVSAEGRPPIFPDDLPAIREAIVETGAVLVAIDPLSAALSSKYDANKDQDVRAVLTRVKVVSEATGAAICFVRHLNKDKGGSALHRGGGSMAIIGAARVGLLMTPDPDDPNSRVLTITKTNLGVKPRALRFAVVDDGAGTGVLHWSGESDLSADDALGATRPDQTPTRFDDAVTWLKTMLAGGSVEAREIMKSAERDAISERTLMRAKHSLGVTSTRDGYGPNGKWIWRLPSNPANPNPQPGSVATNGQHSEPIPANGADVQILTMNDDLMAANGDSWQPMESVDRSIGGQNGHRSPKESKASQRVDMGEARSSMAEPPADEGGDPWDA